MRLLILGVGSRGEGAQPRVRPPRELGDTRLVLLDLAPREWRVELLEVCEVVLGPLLGDQRGARLVPHLQSTESSVGSVPTGRGSPQISPDLPRSPRRGRAAP